MFSRLSLAAGAVAGGIVVFIGMHTVNALWIIPGAREEGRKLEGAEGGYGCRRYVPDWRSRRNAGRSGQDR
ncbi:hypothetical protein GOB08_08795, partial [Sinorhizobium meliloti]|nr:hypothetical protein [Sinorhizobium meliloti]MDX0069914.1 hypothetical protein [Sinorhizobium meliloti]